MPSSSIRNGYSLVPCDGAAVLDDAQPPGRDLLGDPVVEQDHAVGDVLLQALAGERALAALAGDDRGDALVLEPAEQPAQLGAQDRLVRTGRRTASRWCRARRAWRRSSRWRGPGGRTALRGRTRRSPRSRCARRGRSRRAASSGRPARPGRSRASGRSAASSSAVSSKAMNTPGSPNSMAPRTRNSIASSVLPQPAPPQTSVGRPRGKPPPVISSSPWMPVGALGSFAVLPLPLVLDIGLPQKRGAFGVYHAANERLSPFPG